MACCDCNDGGGTTTTDTQTFDWVDSQYGDTCTTFESYPGWCSETAADGSSGNDACCSCGGGTETGTAAVPNTLVWTAGIDATCTEQVSAGNSDIGCSWPNDGACDDGSTGGWQYCAYGTDCTDCGNCDATVTGDLVGWDGSESGCSNQVGTAASDDYAPGVDNTLVWTDEVPGSCSDGGSVETDCDNSVPQTGTAASDDYVAGSDNTLVWTEVGSCSDDTLLTEEDCDNSTEQIGTPASDDYQEAIENGLVWTDEVPGSCSDGVSATAEECDNSSEQIGTAASEYSPGGCEDTAGWVDSLNWDCSDYSGNTWACDDYYGGNQNCCVCGGGTVTPGTDAWVPASDDYAPAVENSAVYDGGGTWSIMDDGDADDDGYCNDVDQCPDADDDGGACDCALDTGVSTTTGYYTTGEYNITCASSDGFGQTVTWTQADGDEDLHIMASTDCATGVGIGEANNLISLDGYPSYGSRTDNASVSLAAGECFVWLAYDWYGYSSTGTDVVANACDIPDADSCDCAGNVLDDCGVCGGDGFACSPENIATELGSTNESGNLYDDGGPNAPYSSNVEYWATVDNGSDGLINVTITEFAMEASSSGYAYDKLYICNNTDGSSCYLLSGDNYDLPLTLTMSGSNATFIQQTDGSAQWDGFALNWTYSYYDTCGELDGGDASLDCSGTCDGDDAATLSNCPDGGYWNPTSSTCEDSYLGAGDTGLDCNDDCGGTAFVDQCDDCVGGNTGVEQCVADCAGIFEGQDNYGHVLDDCGVCNDYEDSNGVQPDYPYGTCDCEGTSGGTVELDCANTCGGSLVDDCFGECDGEGFYLDDGTTCVHPPYGAIADLAATARDDANYGPVIDLTWTKVTDEDANEDGWSDAAYGVYVWDEDYYPDCTGTQSTIGTGYCSSANNNAECGWDGGDCCGSTNPAPYGDGENCYYGYDSYPDGYNCDCQDPDACENIPYGDEGSCAPSYTCGDGQCDSDEGEVGGDSGCYADCGCLSTEFDCGVDGDVYGGNCVPNTSGYICDGYTDCTDGSDEAYEADGGSCVDESLCAECDYVYDETLTGDGEDTPYACLNDCQCTGERTCSYWGWCEDPYWSDCDDDGGDDGGCTDECCAHSDCDDDEYCDTAGNCYGNSGTYDCSYFDDAIDGVCPGACDEVGGDWADDCCAHSDCEDDEYCDTAGNCYADTGYYDCCYFDDAIDGACPDGCFSSGSGDDYAYSTEELSPRLTDKYTEEELFDLIHRSDKTLTPSEIKGIMFDMHTANATQYLQPEVAIDQSIVNQEISNGHGQFSGTRAGWRMIGSGYYYHYSEGTTASDAFTLINYQYGQDVGPYVVTSYRLIDSSQESAHSNEASATTSILEAPTNFTAVLGDGGINLAWSYDGYSAPDYPGCTGNLSWISDGYCDSSNNVAECGYDGGDCCNDTCVAGPTYDCDGDGSQTDADGDGCWDTCYDPTSICGQDVPTCNGDYQFSAFALAECYGYSNAIEIGWNTGCSGIVHLDGDAWFSTDSYNPPVTGTGFEPGSEHLLEFVLSDGTIASTASVTLIDDNCDEAVENCTGTVGYINNGACTASNNNADCEWDGGDCCASTNSMSSGVDGDAGNNCAYGNPQYGEGFYCDCEDPDACENIPYGDAGSCAPEPPSGDLCFDDDGFVFDADGDGYIDSGLECDYYTYYYWYFGLDCATLEGYYNFDCTAVTDCGGCGQLASSDDDNIAPTLLVDDRTVNESTALVALDEIQIITDSDKKMRDDHSSSEYRMAEGFNVYSGDDTMSLIATVYGTFYQVAGDEDGCYAVTAFDTSPVYESALSASACVAADNCPLTGDTNNDGNVNVTDIVYVVNIVLGGGTYEECSDVNGDGSINVGDIVSIVNLILGNARAEGATEAIINVGDNLSVDGNGFIQGAQFTLTHSSPITIELADEYVAYYQTDDMTTTLVVATDGSHSLTDIATISGEYEIAEAIVVNANDQVTTQQVLEVTSFGLSAAYPNPFNPVTSMQLVVPQDGFVSVKVYNLMGQEVATLADGMMQGSSTAYTLRWDASAMASGVYLVKAQGAGQVSTQKLMLLK